MKYLSLLFLISLTSCSQLQQEYRDKELKRIVAEFNQVAVTCKVPVVISPIEFIEVNKKFKSKNNLAGVCYKGTIYLDEMWWSRAYSIDREQVVLHELGHCVLSLKHGKNLMDIKPIDNYLFLEKKQAYIKELFKYKKCN